MPSPSPLRVAVAPCFMHPDPNRDLFQGKRLLYSEEETLHWVLSQGTPLCSEGLRAYTLPSAPTHAPLVECAALWLDDFDALLLQGGADVAPQSYGQEPINPRWTGDLTRDNWEIALIHAALKRPNPLPILGLCRGVQILNVALGGTLIQDIPTHIPHAKHHRDPATYDSNTHSVNLTPDGWLHTLFGPSTTLTVNSVHHQSIDVPAPGCTIEAISPEDDVIEAIQWTDPTHTPNTPHPLVAGVQWHPEWCRPHRGVPVDMTPILRTFLDSARTQKATRSL